MIKLLFLFLFLSTLSCNKSGKINTPKEFLNSTNIRSSLYSRDSISIIHSLYDKMKNHEASFQNPEYFDSTKLYIDTIIYDNTLTRISLFVISKNPIHRNPHYNSLLPFYYNASCYLGKRLFTDSSKFELVDIGPASLINFNSKFTISEAIREIYFSELTTYLNADSTSFYEYNLNDRRFWESKTGWSRVFP